MAHLLYEADFAGFGFSWQPKAPVACRQLPTKHEQKKEVNQKNDGKKQAPRVKPLTTPSGRADSVLLRLRTEMGQTFLLALQVLAPPSSFDLPKPPIPLVAHWRRFCV